MSFVVKPTGSSDFKCKDCPQIVRVIYGYKGARNKVINVKTGEGGLPGQDHICPNRLSAGSVADQERCKKKFMCHRCLLVYPGRFVGCPFCFKLVCKRCKYRHDWLLDNPRNECRRCLYSYLTWTEVSRYVPFPDGMTKKVIDNLNSPREPPHHLIITGKYVQW